MNETATLNAPTWMQENRACVSRQLQWVRALLGRRVLWLRHTWTHQSLHGVAISDAEADWLLAGEDRNAEAVFYATDPAAVAATATLHAAECDASEARARMARSGTPSALDILSRTFSLTRADETILLLCLAPEVDPAFERLYAYVQDDVTRRFVTPHVVETLLAGDDARGRLYPDAPLRRYRLLAHDTQSGHTTLRLGERMVDYLLGTNRVEPTLAEMLDAIAVVPLSASQERLAAELAEVWRARWAAHASAHVTLVGEERSGRRAVTARAGEMVDLRVCEISAHALLTAREAPEELIHLLAREAAACRLAYVVDATNLDASDHTARRLAHERVARCACESHLIRMVLLAFA